MRTTTGIRRLNCEIVVTLILVQHPFDIRKRCNYTTLCARGQTQQFKIACDKFCGHLSVCSGSCTAAVDVRGNIMDFLTILSLMFQPMKPTVIDLLTLMYITNNICIPYPPLQSRQWHEYLHQGRHHPCTKFPRLLYQFSKQMVKHYLISILHSFLPSSRRKIVKQAFYCARRGRNRNLQGHRDHLLFSKDIPLMRP